MGETNGNSKDRLGKHIEDLGQRISDLVSGLGALIGKR